MSASDRRREVSQGMPRDISTTLRSGGAEVSSAGRWGGDGKDAGCVEGGAGAGAAAFGLVACCPCAFLFAFVAGWRRRTSVGCLVHAVMAAWSGLLGGQGEGLVHGR